MHKLALILILILAIFPVYTLANITQGSTYALKTFGLGSGTSTTGTAYALEAASAGFLIDGNSSGTTYNAQTGFVTASLYANPQVIISSPSAGSTSSSSSVTVSYTLSNLGSSDVNALVKKFWVSVDSAEPTAYLDNYHALSYTFSSQTNASHTYRVKSMNWNDQNTSTASVTITVSVSSGDTPGPGPTGGSPGGGGPGGGCGSNCDRNIVVRFEDVLIYEQVWDLNSVSNPDFRTFLIALTGNSDLNLESSQKIKDSFSANRKLQIYENRKYQDDDYSVENYWNKVTVFVQNLTQQSLGLVQVGEFFASDYLSDGLLVPNTVITTETVVPELPAGFLVHPLYQIDFTSSLDPEASAVFYYSIDRNITPVQLAAFQTAPIPFSDSILQPENPNHVDINVDSDIVIRDLNVQSNEQVTQETIELPDTNKLKFRKNVLNVLYKSELFENGTQVIQLVSDDPTFDLSGYSVVVSNNLFVGITDSNGFVRFRVPAQNKYVFSLKKDSLNFQAAFKVYGLVIDLNGIPEFGNTLKFTFTDSDGNPLTYTLVTVSVDGRQILQQELSETNILDYVVNDFGDFEIRAQVNAAFAVKSFTVQPVNLVQQVFYSSKRFVDSVAEFIFGKENFEQPLLLLLFILFTLASGAVAYFISANLFEDKGFSTRKEYRHTLVRLGLTILTIAIPLSANRFLSLSFGIGAAIIELGILAGIQFYWIRIHKKGLTGLYKFK
ncbi:MAG: hypothetical protein Q7S92_00015 [Candidatus Diapherotrites archaeon]|nr:hypothetical protein [Candidatus Diapherotrites archaeon]